MNEYNLNTIDNCSTIVDVLQCRASEQPNKMSFTFLSDEDSVKASFTYRELKEQALAIATLLKSQVAPGERAVLLYPPGLEFVKAFLGCLYVGVIAVPAYPPRANSSINRIQTIIQDCEPVIALTTTNIIEQVHKFPEFKTLKLLATDTVNTVVDQTLIPQIRSDALAFLQYTSGSTRQPKGVMISHGNLMSNLRLISQTMEPRPEHIGLSWLPHYHDMGLIAGILEPLFVGYHSILMSPVAFLQRPYRWLQEISRYKVTNSGGPNFAYELCIQKTTDEQLAALNLSCWGLAFTGSEPIRASTLDKFVTKFAPCGFRREVFYPCYGMAEATLMVTGGRRIDMPVVQVIRKDLLRQNQVVAPDNQEHNANYLVGCGQTSENQKVIIVDPEQLTQCPDTQVGEIWVAGASVAQGYWKQPEQTDQTFYGFVAETGEGPFLRTGDLGFLQGGELFVTGRLKDLIIMHGQNHYPQDIEFTAQQSHPALNSSYGAAFSVNIDGQEQLVIVHEVQRSYLKQNLDEVIKAVRQAVAQEHSLTVHSVVLIKPRYLPQTTSGKVQRYAARNQFLAGQFQALYEDRQILANQKLSSSSQPILDKNTPPIRELIGFNKTVDQIQSWLIHRISGFAHLPPEEVEIDKPFVHYGLDSVTAISIVGELEDFIDRRLSATLIYDYPSIATLASYLANKGALSKSKLTLENTKELQKNEPIAIIGIGCRFPGHANTPESFWQLLQNGTDTIQEIPLERWRVDDCYSENLETPGKMYTRWGSFLDSVDQFDPQFFGIAPREAEEMDPQQRLLLEVSWEALENAGIVPHNLFGSKTGVFIGISNSDYAHLQIIQNGFNAVDTYTATGTSCSVASGRLSYVLGLEGPSLSIDTACSSSLTAVHLACQSLYQQECNLALAGGVNLILSPLGSIAFSKLKAMAPDGRCKTFDAGANGYVRGEGCGVVVLKRLSDAIKENDPILAVVRGSALNQDGRSNGLTAPSGLSQQAVILAALANAGVSPSEISYVETHGTGTQLGDPIEAQAIGAVLSQGRLQNQPVMIGSVKTNIGHLEAAAGIAGLIKVVLALQHHEIPPHLNFQNPSHHIPWDTMPLVVPTQRTLWNSHQERIAGVSSFGFSGTNTHMIVAEAPTISHFKQEFADLQEVSQATSYLLPLSAHSSEALHLLAAAYKNWLEDKLADPQSLPVLKDICYSASIRRTHHRHRLAIASQSPQELIEKLQLFLQGENSVGIISGQGLFGKNHKLVFVFPGQGSQWLGMGQELIKQEPVFREALAECDRAISAYREWSIFDQLHATEGEFQFYDITVIQPILFAIQVALAKLWRSWGIEPDAIIGHSMGEVAAAYIAGILTLEHAVQIICCRSQLLKNISGQGAMIATELTFEQAKQFIQGYEKQVSIAVSNSPKSTVLAGDPQVLTELTKILEAQDLFWRWVKVDVASHSPQVEPLQESLQLAMKGIQPKSTSIHFYSSVSGCQINGTALDSQYWVTSVRNPVLFWDATEQLLKEDYNIFLEISPHPILLPAIEQGLHHLNQQASLLPSLRRQVPERTELLISLGHLYTQSYPYNWQSLYSTDYRYVQLPTYQWHRRRCWFSSISVHGSSQQFAFQQQRETTTSLLGKALQLASQPQTYIWETDLDLCVFPFLQDHCIQDVAVVSIATYIDLALAVVQQVCGDGQYNLSDMQLHEALYLSAETPRKLQVTLSLHNSSSAFLQFYSHPNHTLGADLWILHATAMLDVRSPSFSLQFR